uniref:Ribonuclease H2 subunit B n=1 Tax=Cacopsylla melanoneura TaxID=428564 RepID=A0A8D8V8L8_9HEMI
MPPKAKAMAPKKVHNSQSDGMVLLCKDNVLNNSGDTTPNIMKLRHPHSNQAALFLVNADHTRIQEIVTFNEENRSWFIDENVRSDGKLHLATTVNPLYLALPYLINATTLSPLDQTLIDREFPETRLLLKCLTPKLLSLVADRKGDEDMNVWKYNEDKTVTWLSNKVNQVMRLLEEKHIHANEDGVAMSSTFVKTKADTDVIRNKETYLRYSHGIVSEYLPSSLSLSLLTRLGLEPVDSGSKRKLLTPHSTNTNPEPKRIKLTDEEIEQELFVKSEKQTPNKPVVQSAKEKARARSASGTKPISSFFKKM